MVKVATLLTLSKIEKNIFDKVFKFEQNILPELYDLNVDKLPMFEFRKNQNVLPLDLAQSKVVNFKNLSESESDKCSDKSQMYAELASLDKFKNM